MYDGAGRYGRRKDSIKDIVFPLLGSIVVSGFQESLRRETENEDDKQRRTQRFHVFKLFHIFEASVHEIVAFKMIFFWGLVRSVTSPCERRIQFLSDAIWCFSDSNQYSRWSGRGTLIFRHDTGSQIWSGCARKKRRKRKRKIGADAYHSIRHR